MFLGHAGQEAVISSTDEGTHSPGSLHYAGLAVDVSLPGVHVSTAGVTKELIEPIFKQLKSRLDDRLYDVVLEADHYHIEYDPKG